MKRTLAATLVFVSALALDGRAQPTQPVYLQYDGFVRNKDTQTITLSFGYYNMNHGDVRIPAGDANGFLPAPADRNQPLTLLDGRHRFACAIVVPERFNGKLQWQVRVAGRVATTTEKVLDPVYELEAASARRVMAGLDVKTAPRGVCVNRAPTIQLANPNAEAPPPGAEPQPVTFATRVGMDLTLNGEVHDDGLPRDSRLAIQWRKVSGQGTVLFAPADQGYTRATFGTPGEYELELSASDGDKSDRVRVRISVSAPTQTGGG